MLIALIGPPCAGKTETAKYLIVHHHFRPVFVTSSSSFSLSRSEILTSLISPSLDNDGSTHFDSCEHLLDYATAHWRDRFVTVDLSSAKDLAVGFDKRPFFLLVAVEAPVIIRWNRSKSRTASGILLEDFVALDDDILYGSPVITSSTSVSHSAEMGRSNSQIISSDGATGEGLSSAAEKALSIEHPSLPKTRIAETKSRKSSLSKPASSTVQGDGRITSIAQTDSASSSLRPLLSSASFTITNSYSSIASLHTYLSTLSLPSVHRLRPTWDTYFLSLCTLASLRSNCMKRRVGAVLIRSNRVLSTGYNGTPRGLTNCNEGGCPRCNAGAVGGTALDECLCLHAEENALLECGRERGGVEGTVLYCNTCPCLRCAVKIVQTGVKEVVYQLAYSMDDRSRKIFSDAGVKFRQYQPL